MRDRLDLKRCVVLDWVREEAEQVRGKAALRCV
jgi:hypothetical protein